MSDASALEVRMVEGDTFEPQQDFVRQANVTDESIYQEFEEEWPQCWERAAQRLDWYDEWDQVLNDSNPPFYEWFNGGSLNATYNCVDRHIENGRGDEVAIQWEGEDYEERTYTYNELLDEVESFASVLKARGVEEDDVVTLYMPMIPELPIAMLACARIGAPHSVVFAGFSSEALAKRMNAADSQFLITADGYHRRGELLDQKSKADEGLDQVNHPVEAVIVAERGVDGLEVPMTSGRDHFLSDLMENHEDATLEPVHRDAEDMLFLMYTSGTTGTPKGIKHTTGGYMSYVNWTSHVVHDIKPEDTYWCAADIGWITGHSYIVYGPLSLGTTVLMYEGAPDHPNRDRLWDMVERYDVDIFNTAPTAIRAFMKWGREHPDKHDLSSLRWLGTVGEPINPRAWKWYYDVIGDGESPVVDKWWQTETGGNMITTIPGIHTMKPGSAGKALPGIEAKVVDEDGEEIEPGSDEAGYLIITRPWPGMLRTVYGNDERYLETYWEEFSRPEEDEWNYFPADGATVDEDGYITILGRVDDIINVAGHNLSTMELESAIVGVQGVAEAAVVGGTHDVKGQGIFAYVIPEESAGSLDTLEDTIKTAMEENVGPIARPSGLHFVEDLPKTRSGKIMRRLLEDISSGRDIGDTSTLRNPDIVESIRREVQVD
ncbi:MAG: acetate--CoA ligase [bacterium]